MKYSTIIGAIVIIAGIITASIVYVALGLGQANPINNTPGDIACDADAKVCPDGSAVGRDGANNCEFFACPGE